MKNVPALSSDAVRSYCPTLDGVRGLSILLVFGSHYGISALPGGFGVTVFFFISGFLISRLLQNEFEENGKVGLKQFYIRRVLRLAPALILHIVTFSVLWYVLFDVVRANAVWAACLYYFNYFRFAFGSDYFPPFNVLWSLAVEEHFYILFPGIFILSGGMSARLYRLLWGAVALALAWRFAMYYLIANQVVDVDLSYLKRASDTRFDSILYGVILAIAVQLRSTTGLLTQLRTGRACVAGCVLIVAGLGLKLGLLKNYSALSSLQYTLRFSLTAIGLFLIFNYVLFDTGRNFLRNILSVSPLVYVGKLSYSLYLWHQAILVTAKRLMPGELDWGTKAACALVSVLVSVGSYHLVEVRFNALRKRFGSNVRAGA